MSSKLNENVNVKVHGTLENKPFVIAAIPAYNEQKTVARVVLLARRHVDRVLVCDDSSMDLTAVIAEGLGAEVIRHERNLGKGAALRSLFERAWELGADVVVAFISSKVPRRLTLTDIVVDEAHAGFGLTGLKVEVVEEPLRWGKAHALNTALKYASSDIVVLADADSLWARDALREALKYFSDPSVGAVTAVKEPVRGSGNPGVDPKMESTYRLFYNDVRVGESKVHSTPVFHGEFAAFRRDLLFEVGGFSRDVGADDSYTATLIALRGWRAIATPEVQVYELSPNSWNGYAAWRKRRAKHLVQHFSISSRKLLGAPKGFRKILAVESFLHLVNPWLLLVAFAAFAASIAMDGFSPLNTLVMLMVLAALLVRRVREALLTWVVNQVILIYSAVAGILSKELVWRKIQ